MKMRFIMVLFTMLYGAVVILAICNYKAYNKMNNKLDKIASQTDATADKVDSIEADFTEYRQNNRVVIDMLIENIKDYKDEMQEEIDSIYQDIEAVEIAKAEKKQRQATYIPTTYYASTDGLTARGGVNYYGEQKETYYNLNMSRVVDNAKNAGVEGEYWVREDGVKMMGDKVIVAANQDAHPYGSIVETSMGTGIVLDTGGFANGNPTQVDIATDW
jgi:membrane-associated HD superfamily phosphohydrolase